MADKKITELSAIVTIANDDVFPIVDISDNITKKIDITQIKAQSPVQSVNSNIGVVVLTKTDIGLSNVDNTSDANKPVSTAQQTALDAKQATLVSGTNIKTINSTSILGSGNIAISSSVAWGGITGTLSSQTDLQTALDGKVDENASITGATKTKITYDAKGLVTAGADATTADIADSTNKRYVTDAQATVIGNTSGTNSGNQTLANTSDATSHTTTLSATGGSVKLVEGSGITLTTTGTTADGIITIASTGGGGTVTSVGVSMPSAFSVASSPITTSGTIAITGAGVVSQYVRGDGSLANFPMSSGGGSSVSYYLNGSVAQGTLGGVAFKELNKTPVIGAGTDFTISSNGYIESFITDANDPNQLLIPGGNWNFETYFSASSAGGTPSFYVELYKYDGTSLTLIASNSTTPESITGGTAIDLYTTALAVPQTVLTLTDRLALRFYVTNSGRTITLHTENSHLGQIITTFTSGLTALNGLTAQIQSLATGTTGTDFNISSATATHTFNLPDASASNRGALTSADWSTFNGKQAALVSGTNIKTVNSTSLVGSGDVAVQATLVSGTNIKTINGSTILGSGNLTVTSSPSGVSGAVQFSDGSALSSDAANFFYDNTNDRLGLGINAPTARLHVKGSGATSATTSLKIVNSASTDLLNITDDGAATFISDFTFSSTGSSSSKIQGLKTSLDIVGKSGNTGSVNFYGGSAYNTGAGIQVNGTSATGGIANTIIFTNGAFVERLRLQASGNITIGTTTDTASSKLTVDSTTQGFLPPRMTTTQKNAISSPAAGLIVFDTTLTKLCVYSGSAWQTITSV
jgi:hypothetical protein